VLLLIVAVVVGASTTLLGALVGGAQCWALYCGFLEHRFGELAWDAQSVAVLTLLTTAALVASVLGLGVRAASAARRSTRTAPMVAARSSG
jgi:hypothetical protein